MKSNILAVLAAVTNDDLEAIDEKIAELSKELDALREVRKVVFVRLNGAPRSGPKPKKPDDPAKPSGDRMFPAGSGDKKLQQRLAAAKHLLAHGVTPATRIAEACGIPSGSITGVLDHEWFTRTANGVMLSTAGRLANP